MSSSSNYKVYVDLILNSKGFDAKIAQVQGGFDKVKKQAQDTGDDGEAHMGKLSGALGKIGTVAKGVAVAGLAAVGASIVKIGKDALVASANWEQMAGGAQKIFNEIDFKKIEADARAAYKNMGMSANQYLEMINKVGANFAMTMGDEKGYESAKRGMQALADYATGTGADISYMNEKLQQISKATTSYQSIADQFAGILPATSKGFLEAAQSAGFLADKYTELNQVPIDEYQNAVTLMVEKGVKDMGLLGNTVAESEKTLSGSVIAMKASWENLMIALGSGDEEKLKESIQQMLDSAMAVFENVMPYLPMILDGITQLVEGASEFLSNDENRQKIEDALTKLFTALVPVIVKLAVMAVKILWDTLFNTVVGLFTWAQNLGSDLGKALAQGIKDAARVFVQITMFLWNTISGAIGGWFSQMWQKGSQLVSNMANGVRNAAGAVWNAITGAVSGAVNAVRNFFGDMISAGSNIISGLVQGIANGAGAVIEKVKEIASGALDAIKSFFGISSPSRVMASMGGFLMQGFEQGIEKSASSVYSAIDSVSAGVSRRFNPSLTAGISGDFSSLNNVPLNPAFAASGQAQVATVKQYNTINTPVDLQVMNQRLGNAVRRATA